MRHDCDGAIYEDSRRGAEVAAIRIYEIKRIQHLAGSPSTFLWGVRCVGARTKHDTLPILIDSLRDLSANV